jgi:hypothetical protein
MAFVSIVAGLEPPPQRAVIKLRSGAPPLVI